VWEAKWGRTCQLEPTKRAAGSPAEIMGRTSWTHRKQSGREHTRAASETHYFSAATRALVLGKRNDNAPPRGDVEICSAEAGSGLSTSGPVHNVCPVTSKQTNLLPCDVRRLRCRIGGGFSPSVLPIKGEGSFRNKGGTNLHTTLGASKMSHTMVLGWGGSKQCHNGCDTWSAVSSGNDVGS